MSVAQTYAHLLRGLVSLFADDVAKFEQAVTSAEVGVRLQNACAIAVHCVVAVVVVGFAENWVALPVYVRQPWNAALYAWMSDTADSAGSTSQRVTGALNVAPWLLMAEGAEPKLNTRVYSLGSIE